MNANDHSLQDEVKLHPPVIKCTEGKKPYKLETPWVTPKQMNLKYTEIISKSKLKAVKMLCAIKLNWFTKECIQGCVKNGILFFERASGLIELSTGLSQKGCSIGMIQIGLNDPSHWDHNTVIQKWRIHPGKGLIDSFDVPWSGRRVSDHWSLSRFSRRNAPPKF